MREVVTSTSWPILLSTYVLTIAVLLVSGALRGGPLLSDTALVAAPIAFVTCTVWFAVMRRRYATE